jgi:hypothetical protein
MIESGRVGIFKAHEAMAKYLRVKHHSVAGEVAIAGDEACIGISFLRAYADQDPMTVYDIRSPGTITFTANGAITAGDSVSSAAAGKVQTGTGGAQYIGKAITTTTADGERIDVMPDPGLAGSVARASIVQQDLVAFPIPLSTLRVWDAPATNVVATTGANDDLALVYNTFGTAAPTVESGDSKAATTTRRVGFQIAVPECYVAGETATMRLKAGMKTTVSDTTATIDLEVYRCAAPTVDICATAATTINSLTAANKDFTLTPTNLVPGEMLDCRVTIAIVDGATGTAVIGQWLQALSALLLDIKG